MKVQFYPADFFVVVPVLCSARATNYSAGAYVIVAYSSRLVWLLVYAVRWRSLRGGVRSWDRCRT
jgi:hypothetical protein